ncbi:MAG: nucleotide exchange factor GrpE [Cyanothece sp. SIO2G6]|nr:nucleotide exchange factor GrpE [Cyanothece sp. SIO2G6]
MADGTEDNPMVADAGAETGDTPEGEDVTFGSVDILAEEDENEATEESHEGIAILQGQIATIQAELDERNSQYKRIAADFENFRRRTQREKSDLETQTQINTITELLPVIDNFERARAQIKPQTDAEMSIHKSYQGVYKQLVDCLKRIGVAPMRSEGEVFDPNLHDAVMREPTAEYDEGVIIEDLMRGYMLGDRVLRHAMVKVAAPPEPSESPESAEPPGSSSDRPEP